MDDCVSSVAYDLNRSWRCYLCSLRSCLQGKEGSYEKGYECEGKWCHMTHCLDGKNLSSPRLMASRPHNLAFVSTCQNMGLRKLSPRCEFPMIENALPALYLHSTP